MNEKLIEEVLKIVKDSAGFVSGQAPEVVQQMLASDIFSSRCWAVFSIAMSLVMASIVGWSIHRYTIADRYDSPIWGLGVFVFSLILILAVGCTVDNFLIAYKINHFPKAYLVEKLTKHKS